MGTCASSEARHRTAGKENANEALDEYRTLPPHHVGPVLGVASVSKSEFLTCGEDKSIALYDADKATLSCSWRGHTKPVNRVIYGRKLGLLYSCSRDGTGRQWKVGSPEALQTFSGHALTVSTCALSPSESRLWTGSRDASVRAWDVETGQKQAAHFMPRNLVTCLKCLPGDEHLAAQGSEDLTLRVWDARQAPRLAAAETLGGYTYFPLCVDVSLADGGGRFLLTSQKGFNSVGCDAWLWDRHAGRVLQKFVGHSQDATACAFLPSEGHDGNGGVGRGGGGGCGSGSSGDSTSGSGGCGGGGQSDADGAEGFVITASKDQTMKVWSIATGLPVAEYVDPRCGMYTGIAIAPSLDEDGGGGGGSGGSSTRIFATSITGGLHVLRWKTRERELICECCLPGTEIT